MKRPELPFSLSDISEKLSGIFNFSRREAVTVIAVVSAAVISALVITVIVMSVRGGSDVVSSDLYNMSAVPDGEVPRAERPFLSDFIIYENKLQESFTGVLYSRNSVKQWTNEEVSKYWIAPEEIAVEHLKRESEKIIMDIFADVP